MNRVFLMACSAFLALVILGGCDALYRSRGQQTVKAQYKPEGKEILIVPFKDPVFDYFESPEGSMLAEQAGLYIRKHKITDVRYGRFLSPTAQVKYVEHKDNPLEAWQAIAALMDCELVLVGEIEEISQGDPRNLGLVKGQLLMSARLFDMTDGGRVVWYTDSKSIVFPEGRPYENGIPGYDISERELRQRLLIKAGQAIGKAFHTHLEPISSMSR